MALQIVAGGSGSGKSQYVYRDIIAKSIENPQQNYIVVVPEQYTMATQKRLVTMHPRKGILNIDVVSFERLAYKVFEEVGGENRPVLDDTGKNLIVRRVLEEKRKELRYFGRTIQKTGFVSELKSVISEMLQYDISAERLEQIAQELSDKDNRMLSEKLKDIQIVYRTFREYLSDHYITSEEILDVLCDVIGKSENIRKSEIVFDGFTGFTPIQYKLLNLILTICKEVCVTVTIDGNEKLNVCEGMHNLFFMSKEMVGKLVKLCDQAHVPVREHRILNQEVNPRFQNSDFVNKELSFLEKNIFRPLKKSYEKPTETLAVYAAATAKDELNYCIGEIIRLTRHEGYYYRDIAIVTGDIAAYGRLAGNLCEQNKIPCFVDHKKSVTDNPAVELIRSALEMIEKNYSYDSVLRYLRTGMTGIDRADIDLLDNYCVAVGIRGAKAWHNPWNRKGRGRNAYPLDYLNALREKIAAPFAALEAVLKDKKATVKDCVTALYYFLTQIHLQEKIDLWSKRPDTGNEYRQLYGKIIELLDKMAALLGTEVVGLREFNRIVDAGFEEIKVGLIPPTADCLLIGDIERTRLDNIKILFFVGMNDGIVPKKNVNLSVLSEADRDCLEKNSITLSASVRQKAFVQRFYLYMLLTKPSDKLYITYAGKTGDGKTLLPSYLIRNLRQMFPRLRMISSESDIGKKYLRIPKSEITWSGSNHIAALAQELAVRLYSGELTGSVSAFEIFASCKFAYFLQYGLGLLQREQYTFRVRDFGTVIHEVLEHISKAAAADGKALSALSDEERRALVADSVAQVGAVYHDTILKDNSRNEYLMQRIAQLADRTIMTVGQQLAAGSFAPDAYEIDFLMDQQDIPLSAGKAQMSVRGKIDRIDICEDAENVYVRVIDYKSGKSDFDLLKTYYGLKMQLVTYMRAAMNIEAKRHPGKNIIPAGFLYYNIDNPMIELTDAQHTDAEQKLAEALRMKGVVSDDKEILRKMDADCTGKSTVIPVTLKKDGEIDRSKSRVMKTEQFEELDRYVSKKFTDMGKQILTGDIALNPYQSGTQSACTYCIYNAICGFTPDLYEENYRQLKKFDEETIWKKIKEGVDENGRPLD